MGTNEDLLLEYIDKLILKLPYNKSFDTERLIKELVVKLNEVGDIHPLVGEISKKLSQLEYIDETETYDSLSGLGKLVQKKGGHFEYQNFKIQEEKDRVKKAIRKGRVSTIKTIVVIAVGIATFLALFYDRIF